jgi:tellurite resistance protein TerC
VFHLVQAATEAGLHVTPMLWAISLIVATGVLIFDVTLVTRKPHEPSMKEAGAYLATYASMAIAFGVFVWLHYGSVSGQEFFAGWLTEYSLSIDNLFIFLIIMSKFAVPRQYQQFGLLVGIILALVMRLIFILIGAAAINAFSWVFYIFGVFLIWTAWKLAQDDMTSGEDEYVEPKVVRYAKRVLPTTDQYHGTKLSIRVQGKRVWTPMFFVLVALGMTDLLFALDSIPAIYGLTQEPYIVFMANIFALMGLRQLYFLIGGLLQRLVYLSKGLAVLLAFIGVKLILHALHENTLPFLNGGEGLNVPEIPILVSLGAIIAILGVTAVASLIKTRHDKVLPGEPKDVEERVEQLRDPFPEYAVLHDADPQAVAAAERLRAAEQDETEITDQDRSE